MARTIPGLRAATPVVRKKPSGSVRIDGPYWSGYTSTAPAPSVLGGALRALADIAIPTPSAAPARWDLLKAILADLTVVLLSLAVVHIQRCCPGLGWRQAEDTFFNVWSDLRQSDLGLMLIYGALTSLLAYSERVFSSPGDQHAQFLSLCKAVAWATLLVFALITLSGAGTMTTAMLLGCAALNLIGMVAWRSWANHRRARNLRGKNARNVLIVGAGRLGHQVADYLARSYTGQIVKGFLDQNRGADPRILGRIEDLPEVARAEFADEIIVALPHDPQLAKAAILAALRNHLDVRVVPDLFGYPPTSTRVQCIGNLPVISLHEESVPEFGLFIKRLLDVVGALIALLLLTPLFTVVSILIKLDSPGPVFYRAERVGRKGRRFLCCKFRTMISSADAIKSELRQRNERSGAMFKITDDPRITRLGHFVRRYSIDELPQFWNVLKGEMSLVGPRPHPVDDCARYQLDDLRRLDMTPGLTGLWQVTARRDPSFQKSMALDLHYIENWNLWMDLRILLKTFPVVLAGTGA